MKKIIIFLIMIFCVGISYAENGEITTSQYYVDTKSAEKQDAVPVHNTNTLVTYDSTSNDGIGTKAIYDTSSSYATQTDALVTAATANAAIQNGMNSEFTCANPPKCNLWNLTGHNLPESVPGYTTLEYIESTGTQYIDTGLTTGKYVHDIMFTSTGRELMGVSPSHGFYWGSKGGNRYELGIKNIFTNTQQRQIVEYNSLESNVTLTANGETINDTVANTNATNSYCIFHINVDYGANYYSSARLYDFKVYNNSNVLIQHLIPAIRNGDGEIGMYDTVTNTFFANQGEGSFIAGPGVFVPQNQ